MKQTVLRKAGNGISGAYFGCLITHQVILKGITFYTFMMGVIDANVINLHNYSIG